MKKTNFENINFNINEDSIARFGLYCKSENKKTELYGDSVTYVRPRYDKLLKKLRDKSLVDEPANAKKLKKINAWMLGLDIPMYVSNVVCGNAVVRFEISLLEEEADIINNEKVKLAVKFERKRKRSQFARSLQEHKSELAKVLSVDFDKLIIDTAVSSNRAVSIELPNTKNKGVCLFEMLQDEKFQNVKYGNKATTANCPFVIGKTVEGNNVVLDFEHEPHLLISGNKQDKNDFINSMLMSMIFASDPNYVRTILIDLDGDSLSKFEDMPHIYGAGVCTDIEEADMILWWLIQEMRDRYTLFNIAGCRSLEQYNDYAIAEDCMIEPRIVVVIPEIAPYVQQNKKYFGKRLAILAQKARLIGINIVIGSSVSTRDVFTGVIKTSYRSHIAFKQNSKEESRMVGVYDSENLLGDGDMLIYHQDITDYERVQGCKVTPEEIDKVTQDVYKRNYKFDSVRKRCELKNESDEQFASDDPLLKDAVRYAVIRNFINHGVLIRDLDLSISRARQLLDTMIEKGYVAPEARNGNRKVYVDRAMFEKEFGEELYFKGDKH